MSIMYCEKHDRRWDSDKLEECPLCETQQEQCVVCMEFYPAPVSLHHDQAECDINTSKAA